MGGPAGLAAFLAESVSYCIPVLGGSGRFHGIHSDHSTPSRIRLWPKYAFLAVLVSEPHPIPVVAQLDTESLDAGSGAADCRAVRLLCMALPSQPIAVTNTMVPMPMPTQLTRTRPSPCMSTFRNG